MAVNNDFGIDDLNVCALGICDLDVFVLDSAICDTYLFGACCDDLFLAPKSLVAEDSMAARFDEVISFEGD